MQIRIVAVGRAREGYIREGMREYCARIAPYHRIELIDVQEEKVPPRLGERERESLLAREGERILAAAGGTGILVACAVDGAQWSSEEFAYRLKSWEISGQPRVTFAIGGPLGLAPSVLSWANERLSLSRMTFPHELVRLVLLEQIYRACRINSGEAYHR
ncbi:MAG: 23S rRNA (pseudouridine(1915)-N(3))-methyltransferase RlmH [Methanolinea sp.]|nr:23S rRNA (pseudouridine(1915)-N(3))-methyltransferase RlmH [Methanolinea sp.]